jgi:hypothetical protein
MEPKLELRDPSDLRVHKLIKDMPQLTEDDQEFENLCASVHGTGHLIEPLKITADNAIVDGRHRWRAAKRCGFHQVPCIIVAEEEVVTIALDTLLARRHMNKGQLAYIAYPLFRGAHEEARQRQFDKLKKGDKPVVASRDNGRIASKTEDFASELGVSRDEFFRAARLHEIFEQDTIMRTLTDKDGVIADGVTFKEFFEPRILRSDKPYGLGGVLAGIAYIQTVERNPNKRNGGKPQSASRQLELFNAVLHDELNRWEYWQGFSEEEQAAHFRHVRNKAAGLPPDQCADLAEYHGQLAAEFRKAAKRQEATSE